MNKKTVILIMIIVVVILLVMSVWGMSVENNREIILLSIPLLLLGVIAFLSRLLLKAGQEEERFRQEREELRREKGKLLHIVNTMPLLYINQEMVTDENGVITDVVFHEVNDRFAEEIMKREYCVGKRVSEVFPDSKELFVQNNNLAKQTGRPTCFQYYYPQRDIFYDITVYPGKDGRFMAYFCADHTNLYRSKKEEERLLKQVALALEVSHVFPWQWEIGKHTGMCQKTGRNEAGQLVYDNIPVTQEGVFSHVSDDDRARVQKAVDDLISGKTTFMKEEYRTVPVALGFDKLEWVESTAIIGRRSEDGQPLSLVGSFQIITRRKRQEEELVLAKQHAEEANRLKSAFLANMSHEIRTPLNAIVGFSNLLADGKADADKRNKYRQVIEFNNELLLKLISDILDLSKIESGVMEFTFSEFDLNQLMKEMDRTLRQRMDDRRPVTLSYKCGLERCVIRSERNRLTQLVTNLVINAIKFTDSGTICFGYVCQGDMLRFYVEDTGCGIPKDKQQDILNRFVKLDGFKQGAGLGLAICRNIVKALGGEMGVESEPGKGSRFWFTVPYVSVEMPVEASVPKQDVLPSSSLPYEVSILVAEDNASNYELVSAILSDNYNLFHAWNGREAVALFKEYRPQLILMDINMPEMDGYEATRAIRKLSKDIPIIALTAYAYASDEERILASGMNAYMSKPINARQLCEKVISMLDTKKS